MKYLITILLFQLYCLDTLGQEFYQRLPKSPYERLVFDGLQAKWYTTFFEASNVTDSTDGYNGVRILDQTLDWEQSDNTYFTDEAIYQAYTYEPSFSKGIFGSIVEKIDQKTGQLQWRKYFGLPDNNASIIRNIAVTEDGHIEIAFLELINGKKPLFLSSRNNVFSYRILSKFDGKEISYAKGDEANGAKIIYSVFQNSNDLFRKAEGKYRYFPFYLKDSLNSFDLNNLSSLISVNTTKSNQKFDTLISNFGNFWFEIKKIDNGNYIITDRDTLDRLLFREVTPNHKIVNSTYSDEPPSPLYAIFSLDFDTKGKQFLFTNRINPVFPNFLSTYELYKLDLNGQYTCKYIIPQVYETRFHPIEWKNNDTIYLLATNLQYTSSARPYSTLDVLRCIPGDTCRVFQSFLSKDSVRFAGTFAIFDLGDDVFVKWIETAYFQDSITNYFKFDRFAYALSSLLISSIHKVIVIK